MGGDRLQDFMETRGPLRKREPEESQALTVVQNTQALEKGVQDGTLARAPRRGTRSLGLRVEKACRRPPHVIPSGLGQEGPVPRDGGAGRGFLI